MLLKTEVFQIDSSAIQVLNTLGHGLVEKPDQNALVVEFLAWEHSVPPVPNAFGS